MTLEELRTELERILSFEEQPNVDWEAVMARCLRTLERLNTEPEPPHPLDLVYHFLDDPDVRQKDRAYGEMQRQTLTRWLSDSA